ncbi:MAG: J domain-containing protein [Crocinitomicaceae bacterium]|nr:J domain-containing protein [Crocinitomicaceae bacterium]
MSWKARYYEVFGLTETATKLEVKRQYRKLAMKFHPDKNPDPKANQLFLDLTEAYQILMDDSAARPTQNIRERSSSGSSYAQTSTKSAAEQRDERYRQGRERYQQYMRNKKIAAEQSFQRFTSGMRWKIFKISSSISFIVGMVLIVDTILPTREENHIIEFASTKLYNGITYSNIREVGTDKNLLMYLADFHMSEELRAWPLVKVKRSFIFHNPIEVKHEYYETTVYPVDFSVVNLFPFLSIVLLIPGLTYRYKKRSSTFYMSYYFSQYFFTAFAVYIVLSQYRWLHLLTLGFI